MTITITVAGRIATATATTQVVAGNTYPVAVSLDSEWTGNLFMRVRFGSLFYDIPFASTDTAVDVQFPVGYPEAGIGVFSEALQVCTNEVRVKLLRSILEAGEQVVEFDSDLYDQWAGEVSELLCDDAFDSTSDRPVKNSVLTAWKGQVENGAMTIGGSKTFTAPITFTGSNLYMSGTGGYNNLYLQSRGVYQTIRARKLSADGSAYDGVFELGTTYASANSENVTLNVIAPRATLGDTSEAQARIQLTMSADRGNTGWIQAGFSKTDGNGVNQRLYTFNSSGIFVMHAPSYTADNSADSKVVNREMLAMTPTVVHTTGNETVAGAKTFTSLLTASNVAVKDASTPTVTMLKGSDEVASLASDGTQAGITASSQFFGLRGLDATPFGQSPSYTADDSADAKIVTRAMLATTPTVVHTTGAQTIAGTKTFSRPPVVDVSQNSIHLPIQSKGGLNDIVSRKMNSDGSAFDDYFEIGTLGTTSQYQIFRIKSSAPRATLGDTSEAQASISIEITPNRDNTGSVRLVFYKTDGTAYTKTLGTFDGTDWS